MTRWGGGFAVAIIQVAISAAAVNPTVAQTTTKPSATGRAPRTVLVSIPDRKLAVLENGNVIADFAVAVGAHASPSPTGEFTIVNRVSSPTYYHEGVVIPPGAGNPVGTRWIGLSEKGFGIHGTNAPKSIGRAASHGCIRLRNRDVEKLFGMLQVGDIVQIRGERDAQIAAIFGGDEDEGAETVAEVSTEAAGAGASF